MGTTIKEIIIKTIHLYHLPKCFKANKRGHTSNRQCSSKLNLTTSTLTNNLTITKEAMDKDKNLEVNNSTESQKTYRGYG